MGALLSLPHALVIGSLRVQTRRKERELNQGAKKKEGKLASSLHGFSIRQISPESQGQGNYENWYQVIQKNIHEQSQFSSQIG